MELPEKEMNQTVATLGYQIGQFIEREWAEDSLRRSEALKGAILQTALDCIITIDHEGNVIEWNAAAEKTFGYSRAEALGQELAELIVPPSLRERHRKGMEHYLGTGEGPVLDRRIEVRGLRADGGEFPVELAVTRIPSDGPPLFTAYLRDIKERKEAEAVRAEQLRLAAGRRHRGGGCPERPPAGHAAPLCRGPGPAPRRGLRPRLDPERAGEHAGTPGQRRDVHAPRRSTRTSTRRTFQDWAHRAGAEASPDQLGHR